MTISLRYIDTKTVRYRVEKPIRRKGHRRTRNSKSSPIEKGCNYLCGEFSPKNADDGARQGVDGEDQRENEASSPWAAE
jgi:hypothetical protein